MSRPLAPKKMPEGYHMYVKKAIAVKAIQISKVFVVKTLKGTVRGQAGDYLIEGIRGELYSCAKSIFEESYVRQETTEQLADESPLN